MIIFLRVLWDTDFLLYMGRNRQPMIRNIYDSIKKDQNGNIFVVDFKKLFNANKYNDIFGGQKTKEYIYY